MRAIKRGEKKKKIDGGEGRWKEKMERKEIGCVRKGKRLLYQSTRVSYQKLASRVE